MRRTGATALTSLLLLGAVPAVPAVGGGPDGRPRAMQAATTYVHCLNRGGSRYHARIRPERCAHFGPGGSFGGGVNLASLRWTSWGGASARATGIERGFHLPYSRIPVRVRAYRPRTTCGRRLYTRLRATSRNGTTTVRMGGCGRSA